MTPANALHPITTPRHNAPGNLRQTPDRPRGIAPTNRMVHHLKNEIDDDLDG
jgi:hypothetical protein